MRRALLMVQAGMVAVIGMLIGPLTGTVLWSTAASTPVATVSPDAVSPDASSPDATVAAVQAPDGLWVDVIDVEGGQATLIKADGGDSVLIDAGWPGYDDRDATRIATAAKARGLTQIDYLIVTHYHRDHVGGVPALAAKIPIKTFVDHGPTVEKGEQPDALFAAYLAARAKGRHLQVKPGDRLPIKGFDVTVVSAGGDPIAKPVPGARQATANALCSGFTPKEPDPSENARSVGVLIAFGNFRFLDLGDLTWNKEKELVCPTNLLGTVDVYLTTHHGADASGPPVIVHALQPRVAVMNNGAKKGGSPEATRTVRSSPGLEDLWQVHFAVGAGATDNVAEPLIANMDETTAHGIEVSAQRDGAFTVTNGRNGHKKLYAARK